MVVSSLSTQTCWPKRVSCCLSSKKAGFELSIPRKPLHLTILLNVIFVWVFELNVLGLTQGRQTGNIRISWQWQEKNSRMQSFNWNFKFLKQSVYPLSIVINFIKLSVPSRFLNIAWNFPSSIFTKVEIHRAHSFLV